MKPKRTAELLPVVLYMHGGGWILGNAGTHDRLVRELVAGAKVAADFVEYTPWPEVHYPGAIEQGYATARWIMREGASKGLDASRMSVAGESVGGNMTAALTLMAKEPGDIRTLVTYARGTRVGYSRWIESARLGTAKDRRKIGKMLFPLHRKLTISPSAASKVLVRLEFRPLRIFRV
jgi:acetyl esterase/lipase